MSQIDHIRLATARMGIQIYLRTAGKMQLSRVATPVKLRLIASEYTGKTYARSRKGLEQALTDIQAIEANMRTPTP